MLKKTIDILRGMYVRIPAPLRKAIAPLLSVLPADIKYGGTYKSLRKAIKDSAANSSRVLEYQNRRVAELLIRCGHESAHYRRIIDQLGLDLNHLPASCISCIASFPVLTKDFLREHADDLLTRSKESLDEISTSGSSGKPLIFHLDRDRSVKEWAFIHHIWSMAGYKASH